MAKYQIWIDVPDELLEQIYEIEGLNLPSMVEKAITNHLAKPKFSAIDNQLKTVSVDY